MISLQAKWKIPELGSIMPKYVNELTTEVDFCNKTFLLNFTITFLEN